MVRGTLEHPGASSANALDLERVVFEAAGVALWSIDPGAKSVSLSAALTSLVGGRRRKMSIEGFCAAMAVGRDAKALRAALDGALDGAESPALEHSPPGSPRRLRTTLKIQRGEDGLIGLVGVCQDLGAAMGVGDMGKARFEQLAGSILASPGPAALFDTGGCCRAASPNWLAITGARADYAGLRIDELIEEVSAHVLRLHRRAPKSGRLLETEECYLGKDGQQRWLHTEYRQVVSLDGRSLGFMMRGQDITAMVEAQQEAQANAERLRLALSTSGAGVYGIDFKAKTFWASPEFVEIVGRTMTFEEAAGGVWPITHPDDAHQVQNAIEGTRSARVNNLMESRIVTPSGEIKWVETRSVLHHDDKGELTRILGLMLDIDERKRLELVLTEARQEAQTYADRLKVALDAGQAGVFETDYKSRTFWCSAQFVEIIGRALTFEESAQRTWPMTHPDDAEQVAMAIAQAAEVDDTRGFGVVQSRVILPDGQVRWVDTCAELHRAKDGTLEKVVGLVLNIDERKKQELALMEAQRAAEAATEAKSQFLANMSHEIRTPMNGVLGVLHLLEQEALSAEGRDMLGEAQACGRMLAQLLNDVIDFSRIEAGRLELSPEALDAAALLRSVSQLLRPQAEAKGLALTVEVADADAWIEADPVRLRQALFNLLGNAVKFTHAGQVTVRLAVLDQDERQRRLRFEIEDTGVGIPQHAQARLFQRFNQADGSTAREFGGSGLGLAITRTLAEMMGGEVGFVSEEGAGSTFWLEVTAPAVVRETLDLNVAGDAGLAGISVLVVEDNPTNRLVATKILEGLGAAVDTAEDGIYGLEAMARRPYDLVLMDIQMPRLDGMEATRRIRGLEGPAAATPIIGLTANALAHQRADYLAAGMDGVASKPISPPALLAEIASVLSRYEARAETAA